MRKLGSKNKGFWYRTGRGWYSGKTPLKDPDGQHIKDRAEKEAAELAFHVLKASQPQKASNLRVLDVCGTYLQSAKVSQKTYDLRNRFLSDLCDAYGQLPAEDFRPYHITRWMGSHKGWNGSKRMAFQAVRVAFRYCADQGLIKYNLQGMKAEKAGRRVAYFSQELETQLYANANPALAEVIRVMILTGCRPGEVVRLEKRHIQGGDKMLWVFPPSEHKTGSKTGKPRVVRVCAEVADLVRGRTGRIFRNKRGRPWNDRYLKDAFRRVSKKLNLKADQTLYAARHTFAQRQLGKGVPIVTLAAQMGNSPKVCWETYGRDWASQADNDPALWAGL